MFEGWIYDVSRLIDSLLGLVRCFALEKNYEENNGWTRIITRNTKKLFIHTSYMHRMDCRSYR